MNFKKKILTSLISISLVSSLGILNVFASIAFPTESQGPTVRWNYSNYNNGSYVPRVGYLASRFFDNMYAQDFAKTYVQIKLDANNVKNIKDYNDGGDNPGSSADNKNVYFTCDVSSVRTGSNDMMDAYAVSSNLPNPKTDIEDDDWTFEGRNEESEVVALGTVSVAEYNMITFWNDYRTGSSTDNGKWQCQFGMSEKGWSDYNNVIQSSVIQATVNYNKHSGRP